MAQDKLKLKPSQELVGIAKSLKSSTGEKNPYGEVRMAPLQRGYEWTKSNVNAFFTDVFTDTQIVYDEDPNKPGKPGKFYGVVIFIERPSLTKIEGHESDCEIVDGQQRITTIFLLSSILKDHLEDVKGKLNSQINALTDQSTKESLELDASVEYNATIALLQNFLFLADGTTPRLRTWNHLQHLVDEAVYAPRCHVNRTGIIKARDQRRGQTKAFADSIEQLRALTAEKIEGAKQEFIQSHPGSSSEDHLLGQLKFIRKFSSTLLERSYTVKLWSDSPQDGNAAFLSLNSKGKALGTKDIVKALLLSNVPAKATEKSWNEIEKNVGDVDQFLRIFWMLYGGKKLTLEGLAISIGEYLSAESLHIGTTNPKHFLAEAVKTSRNYRDLVQKDKHENLTTDDFTTTKLNQLSQTAVNYRVFVMRLIDILDLTKSDQLDLFVEAIRLCSLMSFTFVGKYQYPQAVEDMYFEMATNCVDFASAKTEISKLHSNVTESCRDLQLKNLKMSTALGILFHLEEATRANTPQASLKWKTMNESVEHVAPQTAKEPWPTVVGLSRKYEDMTAEAGNLTILNRKANSGIKQKPWMEPKDIDNKKKSKRAAFANSTDFIHTLDLASLIAWDDRVINKRSEWIKYALTEIANPANAPKPQFDKFSVWLANNP